MTEFEKAAIRYAWQRTSDPTLAGKLERAFLAGTKLTPEHAEDGEQ